MPGLSDDFYIGYAAQAPPALARRLRRLVIALCLLAMVAAVALVALQGRFADSRFQYGTVETFVGRIRLDPYPRLEVAGDDGDDGDDERYLLVDLGKRGADTRVAGLDGHRVRLSGQRIYRDDDAMIEISGDVEDLGPASDANGSPTLLGEHRLVGEIVDSKCHLGVMKPGDGKAHRACAARCISGGSPPILWVRDARGASRHFLLVGRDGRQLGGELLDFVAEPVAISGEVEFVDGWWRLRSEPSDIARLERGDV